MFVESNSEASAFATVSFKGQVSLFKVKNPDYPSVDSCTMLWQCNITEILKIRNSHSMDSKAVFISKHEYFIILEHIRVLGDGGVMVFLTDETLFEYDQKMLMWRAVSESLLLPSKEKSNDQKTSLRQGVS